MPERKLTDDGTAMLSLSKGLLDRCVKCHRNFRKE